MESQVDTYKAHRVGPLCWPTNVTLAAHLRFVLQARGYRSIDMCLVSCKERYSYVYMPYN